MIQKNLSILITDDVDTNRAMLADMLQSIVKHADIVHAEDGETAIHMVAERIKQSGRTFDLILMDFKMPGIDGQKTTAAIRQIEANETTPVKSVIITWSSVKQAPYEGADDWLPKPPRVEDVQYILTTYTTN